MTKYECGINGYVYDPAPGCDGSPGASHPCYYEYDPAKGDPDNGIDPGTAFEELPEDWFCPECGEPKSEFRKKE